MDKNELIKRIEEDTILQSIKKEMLEATEWARGNRERAEKKECETLAKLRNLENESVSTFNTYDIEKIEKEIDNAEPRSEIRRKLVAFQNLKYKNWKWEENYRKSKAKYYTYIAPILADLETVKQEIRCEMANLERKLKEKTKEYNFYEGKVMKFFSDAEDIGEYQQQKAWICNISNEIVSSDEFAMTKADFYSKGQGVIDVKE